jgi:hypothetical protein
MSFLREVLAPCRFSFAPSESALVKPCAVAATYRYVDSRRGWNSGSRFVAVASEWMVPPGQMDSH